MITLYPKRLWSEEKNKDYRNGLTSEFYDNVEIAQKLQQIFLLAPKTSENILYADSQERFHRDSATLASAYTDGSTF